MCVSHTQRYFGMLCPVRLCCLSLCSEQPWDFSPNLLQCTMCHWGKMFMPRNQLWGCFPNSCLDCFYLLPLSIICSLPSTELTQPLFLCNPPESVTPWCLNVPPPQRFQECSQPGDPVGSAGADERCWECGALCVHIKWKGFGVSAVFPDQGEAVELTSSLDIQKHWDNQSPHTCVDDASQEFWNPAGQMKNHFCCDLCLSLKEFFCYIFKMQKGRNSPFNTFKKTNSALCVKTGF